MNEDRQSNKGQRAEELLRQYFLSLGYFVVRGLKLRVGLLDITDVDLWLYHKHSPIGRERVNVDVKNKKVPQAIERIFWTRGLQMTFGLERCIVATTDRREFVVDFGRRHGVTVIDGAFLSKLSSKDDALPLSEEEFTATILKESRSQTAKQDLARLDSAKSRLISALDFDGCNAWLVDVNYFLDRVLTGAVDAPAGHRLVYAVLSYLLVGLDYCLSDVAFLSQAARREALAEGLRYGAEGRSRTEAVLGIASMLIGKYVPDGRSLGERMRRDVMRASQAAPVEILSDYLSTNRVSNDLFRYARYFSEQAYSRKFVPPGDLTHEGRAFLAVLLDFYGIPRKEVFGDRSGAPQIELISGASAGADRRPNDEPDGSGVSGSDVTTAVQSIVNQPKVEQPSPVQERDVVACPNCAAELGPTEEGVKCHVCGYSECG